MTKRGDSALFHGVAAGFLASFGLSFLLGFFPNLVARLGPSIALILYGFGGIVGGSWAWHNWRRGEAADRRKRGHCVNCDYDLTGNESGVCPECGTVR